jgi:uncharacterized membrane protein (UPF0127 family)
MLWTKAAALCVSVVLLGLACNRTEEPPAAPQPDSGSPAPPPSLATASSRLPPSAAPACTVPFGAPAPIASKPAQCPRDPRGNLTLPKGRVTFLNAPGTPSVEVELARDGASRERGLMYRTQMADNAGMLFSWDDQRERSFWMRNTCLPLDMLFIAQDGTIAGILEQVPTLNEAPRGVSCPVAHVLELNAGWARAHGLTPGMKVAIEG